MSFRCFRWEWATYFTRQTLRPPARLRLNSILAEKNKLLLSSETCSPSQQWENTFNLIPFLFLVFSKACSQLMNVFVTNPQQSYCTKAKRYESRETQAECYLDFEIEDNLVGQLIIALADRESYKKISPTFLRLGTELIFCWKFITSSLIAIRTKKIVKKQSKKWNDI